MIRTEKMFFNKPVILLLLILMTTTNGFVQEDRLTRRERVQRGNRVSLDRQLENSQNLPIRNSDITRQITHKDENTERLYDRRSFRTGTDKFASRNREIDINNNERESSRQTERQYSRRERRNLRVLEERRQQRETNRDTQRHRDETRDIRSTSRDLNSHNQLSFRREVKEFVNEFRSSERVAQAKSMGTTNDRQRASGHRLSSREYAVGTSRQISVTGNQDQSTRRVIERDFRLPVEHRSGENFQRRREREFSEYPAMRQLSSSRRDVRHFGEGQPKQERYTRQHDRNYPVDQDRRFRVNFRDIRSSEDRRIVATNLETRSDVRNKIDRFNLAQDRISPTRILLGEQKRVVRSERRTNSPIASESNSYSENVLSERKANTIDRNLNSFNGAKTNLKDSNSWINMTKTILAAFLIGQILISSSKANKSRFYNTITSLASCSKIKVQ